MAQRNNAQAEERKSEAGQKSIARSVGERIAACRKAVRMDQKELARRLGVKPSTMNRWETGYTPISVYDLVRAAQALRMPTSRLLAEEPFGEAEVHDLHVQQGFQRLTPEHRGVLLTLVDSLLQLQENAEAGNAEADARIACCQSEDSP